MHRATSFDEGDLMSYHRPIPSRPIQVTSEDEREFFLAMETYKQQSGRLFPTWSEVLEVLRSLGYAKRIWMPVGNWAPIAAEPVGKSEEEAESAGVFGWFSTVETPVGP